MSSRSFPSDSAIRPSDNPSRHTVRNMDTTTAYDLWSTVYDTDGNFLQALDTLEMQTLLPQAISMIAPSTRGITAVDLGCGTGRNTFSLVSDDRILRIAALDLSSKMLEICRERCSKLIAGKSNARQTIEFAVFDMLTSSAMPVKLGAADLVVSTLVLEHVPANVFLRVVSTMLKPGGVLLLTNMHSDMGAISQAGFTDPVSGEKIRPVSYPHSIVDVAREAKAYGLEVQGTLKEVSVDEDMVDKLGSRAQKWIGVNVWFGGLLRKIA